MSSVSGDDSGSMSAPAQRLALLKLQQLVRRAAAENELLKAAVHAEADAQRDSHKDSLRQEKLRAKLAQLAAQEQHMDARLCYGLPPEWAAPGGSSSASAGEWCSEWQCGAEVKYNTRAVRNCGTGQEKLEVVLAEQPVRLQVYRRPFAQGGLRQAYYARDGSGGRYVLKRALQESRKLQKRVHELHTDAEAAALSRAVAQAFSSTAGGAGIVEYLEASVVILEAQSGTSSNTDTDINTGIGTGTGTGQPGTGPCAKVVYLKEPWLDFGLSAGSSSGSGSGAGGGSCSGSNRWVKWTRNDGHVFPEGESDTVIQALTHYSLHYLRHRLQRDCMVLDAQGVKRSVNGRLKYTLTDPAVCTQDRRYGRSDCGLEAMSKFLSAHSCTSLCMCCGCSSTGVTVNASGPSPAPL